MKYTILDNETTISNGGDPMDQTNRMIVAGAKYNNCKPTHAYYDDEPRYKQTILGYFQASEVVVGFNLVFDLNWLRREWGFDYSNLKIWDCQLAEFLFSCQENKYPSLDESLEKYGFPPKLDIVKKEYWEKGIDTDQVPREILTEYLDIDLIRTEQLFKHQYHMFQTQQYKRLYPLFRLQCQDLLTLADMRYNGVYFNAQKARAKSDELRQEQENILNFLRTQFPSIPFTLTSDLHLSALLYGGVILEDVRIPIGVYKSGAKVGEVRYRNSYLAYECPRQVEPLKGTEVREKISNKELELVKQGVLKEPRKYWSVNEETLRQLKAKKDVQKIIDAILEYNKLNKLTSTYLDGWPNMIEKMHWKENMIHSQLNQTLVITGRLSSSKPNGQNADKITKLFCESRYD